MTQEHSATLPETRRQTRGRRLLERLDGWMAKLGAGESSPREVVYRNGNDWPADDIGMTLKEIHAALMGITPETSKAAVLSLRAQFPESHPRASAE